MEAMPDQKSTIQRADDAALDHQIRIDRVLDDGVVTLAEAAALRREARTLAKLVNRANRDQRAAISLLRTGAVARQIIREFGPDSDDDDPDDDGAREAA